MFLIPPIVSVLFLGLLWWGRHLPRPRLLAAIVACGVTAQLVAPAFSLAWVLALLLNVAVAVYLTIRMKLAW